MKGVVFTEFLDQVEARHGPLALEQLLAGLSLPSGACYTAVGTYDWREFTAIAAALAQQQGEPVSTVLRQFGRSLYGALARRFVTLMTGFSDARQVLRQLEKLIHPVVQRFYPDAQLPRFELAEDGDVLTLTYRSERTLADLAHGLIEGCLDHYGTAGRVEDTAGRVEDTAGRVEDTAGRVEDTAGATQRVFRIDLRLATACSTK